jgi:site-specific recombinase XerC
VTSNARLFGEDAIPIQSVTSNINRWLITGQVAPSKPASAVRGPTHVVKTGTTRVLEGKEWRRLIDAIPTDTVRDLRDRALIATLTYGLILSLTQSHSINHSLAFSGVDLSMNGR